MQFDFAETRRHKGRRNHSAGMMAEESVARHYSDRGASVVERRWRSEGGEIDLVIEEADEVVFVEVKQSKSFDRAAEALSERQIQRIFSAASEYVGQLPSGQLTVMRFDVALVDAKGGVCILENALSA